MSHVLYDTELACFVENVFLKALENILWNIRLEPLRIEEIHFSILAGNCSFWSHTFTKAYVVIATMNLSQDSVFPTIFGVDMFIQYSQIKSWRLLPTLVDNTCCVIAAKLSIFLFASSGTSVSNCG